MTWANLEFPSCRNFHFFTFFIHTHIGHVVNLQNLQSQGCGFETNQISIFVYVLNRNILICAIHNQIDVC